MKKFRLALVALSAVLFLVYLCPSANAQPISSVLPTGAQPVCTTNPNPPTTLAFQQCCIINNGTVYCGDSSNVAQDLSGEGAPGDITEIWDCTEGICKQLVLTGTDVLNSTGVTLGATNGIGLPQGAACTAVTGLGYICVDTATNSLWIGDGTTARRYSTRAQTAVDLTLADTTPAVSKWETNYECEDTTTYTDFVDSDGDHSEFTEDFWIFVKAQAACGIAFSGANFRGNGEADWTAAVDDVAFCQFSVSGDVWTCVVSTPDTAAGVFEAEATAILAPIAATRDWIRLSGDAAAVAVGSTDGTTLEVDFDDDQTADCTFTLSGGDVTLNCGNTDFVAQPGQSTGDHIFNDFGGTACWTLDPDDGTITLGTNCTTAAFSGVVTGKGLFTTNTDATVALSGNQCHGGYHENSDADAITFTLCDGEANGGQRSCFADRAGGAITVDVADGAETITLADGTAMSAGEAAVLASGIGNIICLHSDSATAWHVVGSVGTVTEETP